jgi:hypothetical protein
MNRFVRHGPEPLVRDAHPRWSLQPGRRRQEKRPAGGGRRSSWPTTSSRSLSGKGAPEARAPSQETGSYSRRMEPTTLELIDRYLSADEQARLRRLEADLNARDSTPEERLQWVSLLSKAVTELLIERGWRGE